MKPAPDYQIGSVVGDFFWCVSGEWLVPFSRFCPFCSCRRLAFGSWILNFCCPRGNAITQKFFQTHTLPTTKGSFLRVGTTTTFISFFLHGKAPPIPLLLLLHSRSEYEWAELHIHSFFLFFLSRPCYTCDAFQHIFMELLFILLEPFLFFYKAMHNYFNNIFVLL